MIHFSIGHYLGVSISIIFVIENDSFLSAIFSCFLKYYEDIMKQEVQWLPFLHGIPLLEKLEKSQLDFSRLLWCIITDSNCKPTEAIYRTG